MLAGRRRAGVVGGEAERIGAAGPAQKRPCRRAVNDRPSGSYTSRYKGDAHHQADRGTSAGEAGVSRPGGRVRRRSPSCHDRSALAAARAKAANAPAGSRRSSTSSGPRPRCSQARARRRCRAKRRAPSPSRPGSSGARSSRSSSMTAMPSSESYVHDRRLKLSEPTVAQTSSIDAGLGVHVDRGGVVVLDPVDGDPVAAGLRQQIERGPSADVLRVDGGLAVLVRVVRHDRDEPQVGLRPEGLREGPRDGTGPEVLVLDVDQRTRPPERLAVGARHAALAVRGERVAVAPARVGAQDLHRVRAHRGRLGRRRGSAPGRRVGAAEPIGQAMDRVAGERLGILPPLPEHRLDVSHDRSPERQLDVVPRRLLGRTRRPWAGAAGRRGAPPSSRRLWQRSMPPTNATSSSGRPGWRITTIFWWCEPSGRTRMSSRHSPPAASISSPR